jgi:beta-glucanase (GH16 family)
VYTRPTCRVLDSVPQRLHSLTRVHTCAPLALFVFTVFAWCANAQGLLPSGLNGATIRYVRAMPVRPTNERILLLDRFVRTIAVILPKLDFLYLTAGHDEGSVAINLARPGQFTLTPVNNPAFVEDTGVRGGVEPGNTAARRYYDTNFSAANDARRISVNNAEVGVFVLSNEWLPDNGSQVEAGNDFSFIKALETVLLSGNPTTVGGRITRNATARTSVGEITTAVGLTSVSRDEYRVTDGYACPEGSANRVCIFKNGVSEGGSSGAPVALGENTFWIGAANNGVNTTGGFSVRRVGAFYAGATLSNSQRLMLYDALVDYLTAIGAYDPASGVGEEYQPPADDPYAPPDTAVWTKAYAGTLLDISGYALTFEDQFASTSTITVDGGGGPWSSPVHSRVGFADFALPTDDPSSFSVTGGVLQIQMMEDAEEEHGWQTGHMQTADSAGRGFSQRYGYFETRMRMPPPGTMGAWPAFWLYSQGLFTDPSQTRAEIDVIEYYPGNNPQGHHSAVHLRPGVPYRNGEVSQHWFDSEYNKPPGLDDGNWHTHGVLLTPESIIVYFDRVEQKRFPMLREFAVQMFMLVSLQGLDQEFQQAVGPINMYVDYVRVYQAP